MNIPELSIIDNSKRKRLDQPRKSKKASAGIKILAIISLTFRLFKYAGAANLNRLQAIIQSLVIHLLSPAIYFIECSGIINY